MKKKPFNPYILLALVLGLAGFYLVYSTFNNQKAQYDADMKARLEDLRKEMEAKLNQPITISDEKKRPVVYAKVPIKPGDRVEVTMLETKDTPESLLLAAFTRPEEVVGQYATANIDIGQPLMPSVVSKQVQRMSVKLTPGMRAISLPIEGVRNVVGFVTDGDLVDMLLTYYTGEHAPDNSMMTRTVSVLQDVKILYAPGPDDYRTDQTRPVKMRPTGDIVTFEVTPDQAEMLTELSQMGVFRLVLRNRDDYVQWKTKGYGESEFFDDDTGAQRRSNRSVQAAADILKEFKAASPEAPAGEIPNAK